MINIVSSSDDLCRIYIYMYVYYIYIYIRFYCLGVTTYLDMSLD